ncbi:unnamed protein product [Durusdinium trenchii]|uniref:Uncharacterized protein n=1 Tax=Durusdinium trenchii TaxID=1381693 RepID=A0ABP0HR93_9DINO
MNLWNDWDPVLDPQRSMPHGFIFSMEIFLLICAILMSCRAILPLFKLIPLAFKAQDRTPELEVEELLREPFPKRYKVAHHDLEVLSEVGGSDLLGRLNACEEVVVVEMACAEGNVTGSALKRLMNYLLNMIFPKNFQSVWGKLEGKGWFLLYDSASDWKGVTDSTTTGLAPYRANQQLLVPLGALVRRQLVLAASHASTQLIILERLAGHMQVHLFLVVAVTNFFLHIHTLREAECTVKWALRHDQALEKEQKRLRPPPSHRARIFSVLLTTLLLATLLGLVVKTPRSGTISSGLGALLLMIALHAWDLRTSLEGVGKWKEPQLTTEFTVCAVEPLPSMDDDGEPLIFTEAREGHHFAVSFLTWLMGIAGLSVVILMGLDGIQMQGSLIHYSFSKGHLIYLAETSTLHNTLLLHDDADTLIFGFEAGDHTENVSVRLEHPQLGKEDAENISSVSQVMSDEHAGSPKTLSGEYKIILPAGPLYSRIIVKAASKLQIAPTEYIFHLIRVGEALSLSLRGQVAGTNATFSEERRWLFQQRNAEWYVPAIDPKSHWTLGAELHTIGFAPLTREGQGLQGSESSEGPLGLTFYDQECRCGVEVAGFGTNCLREQRVELLNSTSICLYSFKAKSHIHAHEGQGSLVTDSGLLEWLQNVNVSGKFAKLRVSYSERDPNLQPGDWQLIAKNKSEICNIFNVSMPYDSLMKATQLVLATTQDETDAEEEAVPLKIVPHPPPITLSTDMGLLLPEFQVENKRSEYAGCDLNHLDRVNASVADDRFHVQVEVVNLGKDCSGFLTRQKRFRAVRTDASTTSCDYCDHYPSWNEFYDVAVTLSPEQCINEAIEANNVEAVHRINSWAFGDQITKNWEKVKKTCGVVQRAASLGRVEVMKELLLNSTWDANCSGCASTPLGDAAAGGKTQVVQLLFDHGVDAGAEDAHNRTALLRAGQHCNIAAVKQLIPRVDVNHLLKTSRCPAPVLLSLLGRGSGKLEKGACKPGDLKNLLTALVDGGRAALSVAGNKGCPQKTALVEAIESERLEALPVLLALGADPNMEGGTGSGQLLKPFAALVYLFLTAKIIDWPSFAPAATLLLQKGADVNARDQNGGFTALMEAAAECQPKVVELLVKHGAAVDLKDNDDGKTAVDWAKESCEESPAALKEIQEILSKGNS